MKSKLQHVLEVWARVRSNETRTNSAELLYNPHKIWIGKNS